MTQIVNHIAKKAAEKAGFSSNQVSAIRIRDNSMLRIVGAGAVIRVHQQDARDIATQELHIAKWLRDHDIGAPKPLVDEPFIIHERPVTLWEDLGNVGEVPPMELGKTLRKLHALPIPESLGLRQFKLPNFEPFIKEAQTEECLKEWLYKHSERLKQLWDKIEWLEPWQVIHGDPAAHNTMQASHGACLVDLERFSIGPKQWDQATIAFQSDTLAKSPEYWEDFKKTYKEDVTKWSSYNILRDIRSLELCLFALRHADKSAHARKQADYRLHCLMGLNGNRPWGWVAP